MLEISAVTARRYVMGRSGLWPGRRWRGLEGTAAAMRAMEDLQLDPLVVVARAHDLMLHSRVADYPIDGWATLTYERRQFFEWGGWLAVRPMEELPYFRVVMGRERELGRWRDLERDHAATIDEMRAVLRARGEVSNRDFAMHERTRVDDYRGRKDSALVLHYLWRVGEVMVTRRERFERVYALTEAVAPAAALREVDPEEADDILLRKSIAADGLSRQTLGAISGLLRRVVSAAELAERRTRWLAAGDVVEVRVEGWRATQLANGSDARLIDGLEAGRVPAAWRPIETTTDEEATFLSPLDPVSARGRAKPLFGFDYAWEVYKPAELRRFGYYTLPILWGDRLVGRFDPKLDRATGTLVINGLWLEDPAFARDETFATALAGGMVRFLGFLGAKRVDAAAVPQPALRKRLAAVKPDR
ncbi:MAG: crosslink repair DNA glycosylase YcaQ family protein [Chloroflexota bacterium]